MTTLQTNSANSIRICTANEMRELDAVADREYGIDAIVLMENAGRAAATVLLEKNPMAGVTSEILVFAGKGNNAGDAFVVARRLICMERKVRIFHLEAGEKYHGATKRNFEILKQLRAKLTYLETIQDLEAFFQSSAGPYIVVDGILGTGLHGQLEGIFYDVVEMINSVNPTEVMALDIPTGVSGDTGAIHGASIQASLTVSFGFPKIGHFLPPGAGRRGELVNCDISLPPKFRREGDKFLLMRAPMAALLKERDRYGHKNSFGHTLLVGGSPGRLGAIAMAARASHRMGTGLVTVATWEDAFDPLLIKLPNETMAVKIPGTSGPEYDRYRREISEYSSVVAGPGMGQRPEAKTIIEELLQNYDGPLVLDADALNVIAEHKLHQLLQNRRAPTVLTPHPGEMARLLGISKEEVRRDPVAAIREAVRQTHSVVILKGAATLITSPEEKLYLNHYPNDGMATAGSGDVLAGMIGGLLGQSLDAFKGTQLGVYLHSLAGEFAARQFGHRSMTAPDIIENISNAIKEIKATEPWGPVEASAKLL